VTNKFSKIIITFLLLSLWPLSSCDQSESYILTAQATARIIERQDHQQCVSSGMDLGKWGDIITEIYWRCRYNLVQNRMTADAVTTSAIKNNAVMKRISVKLLDNLNRSKQAILSKAEYNIDTLDHSKCIAKGYILNSTNEAEITDYYKCRQRLVFERNPPAPDITYSYEASTLPGKKFEQYLVQARRNSEPEQESFIAGEMLRKYPTCIGLNVQSRPFKRCIDAQKKAQKCLNNMNISIAKKQLEDIIYCQQQAFIQFPDNYSIAEHKSASVIEKEIEYQEELQRNKTLEFLESGRTIQVDKLELKEVETAEEIENKLYNKIKLLRLREQFIARCNNVLQKKLPIFIENTTNSCGELGGNWDREIND